MHRTLRSLLALLLVTPLIACGDKAPAEPPGTEKPGTEKPAEEPTPEKAAPAPEKAEAPKKPDRNAFDIQTVKVVYALEGQTTGTRTLYVEDFGARVGVVEKSTTYGEAKDSAYYWDGKKGHLRRNPGEPVSSMGLRVKVSEPTSFATTPAVDLERVGYVRVGDKTIAGQTCEHWKNEKLNYEGCRWKGFDLEFLNGAGTPKIKQRTTATAVVEGEAIPDAVKALKP